MDKVWCISGKIKVDDRNVFGRMFTCPHCGESHRASGAPDANGEISLARHKRNLREGEGVVLMEKVVMVDMVFANNDQLGAFLQWRLTSDVFGRTLSSGAGEYHGVFSEVEAKRVSEWALDNHCVVVTTGSRVGS